MHKILLIDNFNYVVQFGAVFEATLVIDLLEYHLTSTAQINTSMEYLA
jgi:hypothetical protein